MESQSQEERLQKEILAEAKSRADKIVARAQSAANSAKARAEKEIAELRERTLEQSRKDYDQKARNIIQGIWMEERKMWLRKREECLETFFASLLKEAQELKDGDSDREKSLRNLAREALEAVDCDEMVVKVSNTDAALVTSNWLEEIAGRRLQATIVPDESVKGGLFIESADGRLSYDNTYAGRLLRLKETFRRELASCDKE
ncbi:MAG: V-type ATP synthase subunit E [Lentisphaeria bacterium]|nr:V-type ATP synthase subunit E [Lentisphaeria bacterium]